MSDRYDSDPASTLQALEGLARVTAGAWFRTAAWGLGASVRLARAASDPRQAANLVQDVGHGLRDYAREFLGVSELDARVRQVMPVTQTSQSSNGHFPESDALREAGAELLRQSTAVDLEDAAHPAFVRIIEELAPDEARVLRLLAASGPQPSVDVKTFQVLGIGSRVLAEGLNMIGQEAGVRYVDRVPSYLNNLNRLGLVWFSKEPVNEPIAYQVLEAQPDVLRALKAAPRTRTVERSVRLTPFGRDFCEAALPPESATDSPAADQDVGGEPLPDSGLEVSDSAATMPPPRPRRGSRPELADLEPEMRDFSRERGDSGRGALDFPSGVRDSAARPGDFAS